MITSSFLLLKLAYITNLYNVVLILQVSWPSCACPFTTVDYCPFFGMLAIAIFRFTYPWFSLNHDCRELNTTFNLSLSINNSLVKISFYRHDMPWATNHSSIRPLSRHFVATLSTVSIQSKSERS